MAQPTLVVDLGSYATTAAVVASERAALVRDPNTGANMWPATARLEGFGKDSTSRPLGGPPDRIHDADPSVDPTAVTARLAAVRAAALRVCGDPIERITLLVPPGYAVGDPRRDLLIGAAEAAGFIDVELLGDDQAAVLDAQDLVPLIEGALVLVCDLGQTWTTSLLQWSGTNAVPLAHETSPAGRDLDDRLFADLCDQTRSWLEPRLAAPGAAGGQARTEAMDLARSIKHALADREEAGRGGYRLTRDWLTRLAEPGLRWAAASCRGLLARAAAGVAPSGLGQANLIEPDTRLADVAAVLLVGGDARLDCAELLIATALGRPVLRPEIPELAALRGGVRWARAAGSRRILAEHPKWRVEPVVWDLPGGRARISGWAVAEGQPYPRGAVVAQVVTAEERRYDLTAADDGIAFGPRASVGDIVGPTLVTSSKRPASCLAGDPPGKRLAFRAAGEWLLTPDHRVLVECAPNAAHVKLWSIPDGALLREFRPDVGPGAHQGRVFINPGGRLSLVAWDSGGSFSVFDVGLGRRLVAFRDTAGPTKVRVHEGAWRLTSESEDGGSAGRYRRPIATVWDLGSGQRLERYTADWQRHLSGYRDRSAVDGFGDRAASPDGQLLAVPVRTPTGATAIALQATASERELFRTEDPPSTRARMAFTNDGQFLLANWESQQGSRVDVWEI